MTTSMHGQGLPWNVDHGVPELAPHDGRLDDAAEPALSPQDEPSPWPELDEEPDDWGPADETPPVATAPWGRAPQYAGDGLSGRGLVVSTALAAGSCAVLDMLLTAGRITFFFDLCFVVICLVATMAVRREDLFTAGVLPPLLFAAVIAAIAIGVPHAFESAPGVNKVFLSGLASHTTGLVGGYGVALLAVAARMIASPSSR